MAKTFENDEALPSLPLPDLSQTLEHYLESVRPCVDDNEFEKTVQIVKEFQDGDGHILQEELKRRSESKRNWLEDWWNKYAYLKSRAGLALGTNFGGAWINPSSPLLPLIKQEAEQEGGCHLRAKSMAIVLRGVLEFWLALKSEKIPPFKDGRGLSYSMSQFRNFFNASRIPQQDEDVVETHFTTDDTCPDHVVVICKGRFFKLKVTNEETGSLLSDRQLEAALVEIENNVNSEDSESPGCIGTLTCGNRDKWAQNYKHLQNLSPMNKQTLEDISRAICTVVLNDSEPETEDELLMASLVNDASNLWADKSLNFNAHQNGLISSQSDHSLFDGMVSVEANLFGLGAAMKRKWGKSQEAPENLRSGLIKELLVETDDFIEAEIESARKELLAKAENVQAHLHVFDKFGKTRIKEMKVHPDTFLQICIQVAAFKAHGRPLSTYETATTRQFYRGRTETVRSCTSEAVDLAKGLLDENNCSRENLLELLMKAVNKHNSLMQKSMQNKGCDRHLLGLKILALERGLELPEIFKDSSFTKSGGDGNFSISTSLCGYTPVTGGCTPFIEDGYGVYYAIPNDKVLFWTFRYKSSKFTDSNVISDKLKDTLLQLEKIILKSN